MKKFLLIAVWTMFVAAVFCSCGSHADSGAGDSGDRNVFEAASFIRGVPADDSVSLDITIVNPWDTTGVLARYKLVNRGESAANSVAKEGTVQLLLPLKRLIVYSSVHAALLVELGYAEAIVGVADAEYIKTPELVEQLKDGRTVDIGSSLEPSIEKILALKPDAILISPFQNTGHGVVDKAGVPVIECADYMESTPLGRAEWSKFYAMLAEGIAQSNSRIFDESKAKYQALVDKAAKFKDKPKVITDLQTNGTWLVPGGGSYAARFLTDAGAIYPFGSNNNTPGSVPMNYEKVYMTAQDADFWLIKSFGDDMTLNDVADNHQFNKNFLAYKNGGIYNANTSRSNLFEETPFHPERLLADYVAIFHHTGDSLRYFAPVR